MGRASSPLTSKDRKKPTAQVIDLSQEYAKSEGNGNEEKTEPYYKTKKEKTEKRKI